MAGSMLAFALAVWACGLAGTLGQLIGWRFVQGMAGGLMIPVGQAAAFNLFQGPERARISTLVMAVALIAPALSPWLGGLIVDNASWRWIFHSNIPLALAAAALAWGWVRDTPSERPPRPDLKGLALISIALASLLTGMSLYGAGQNMTPAWICLATGAASAFAYVLHYRRSTHAIVELKLLGSPRLRLSVAVYHAIPGVFTGVNLLNIFYLQDVLGMSARATGMLMIVYAGGAFVAMMAGGRLYNRAGMRPLFLASMALHSLGVAALAGVTAATDTWLLVAAYGLMGLGGGLGQHRADHRAAGLRRPADASGQRHLEHQPANGVQRRRGVLPDDLQLLATHLVASRAYHLTFVIASLMGLLPALQLRFFNTGKRHHAGHSH